MKINTVSTSRLVSDVSVEVVDIFLILDARVALGISVSCAHLCSSIYCMPIFAIWVPDTE